jgi:steroid delta-isomerase-like uncharacterized protein
MRMDYTATMRSAYDRINAGDLAGFGDLVADDFIEHEELPGLSPTKQGVLDYFRMLLSAFPDMQMQLDDLLVSGDKAVARVKIVATHKGEFLGVPATGRRVEIQLIDIMRFDDAGLLREHWGVADMLALLQQIGAVPDVAPA